jgi:hypothetical protein
MRYQYNTCCVDSDGPSINAMSERARPVTYRTFDRHCDWTNWARGVGYSVGTERGLHLKNDYHVAYFKSVYRGEPCYYLVWSAIEVIFTKAPGTTQVHREGIRLSLKSRSASRYF